jgi:hypothetical protein
MNIADQSLIDYSDEWSEDDLRDFSRSGWSRFTETSGDDETTVQNSVSLIDENETPS